MRLGVSARLFRHRCVRQQHLVMPLQFACIIDNLDIHQKPRRDLIQSNHSTSRTWTAGESSSDGASIAAGRDRKAGRTDLAARRERSVGAGGELGLLQLRLQPLEFQWQVEGRAVTAWIV